MTKREATPSRRLKNGLEMRSKVCHHPGTRRASQKKAATEADTTESSEANPVRVSPSRGSRGSELDLREKRLLIASLAVLSFPSDLRDGKMVADGGEYTLKQTRRQAGMTMNWKTAKVCPIHASRVPRVRMRTVERKP